MDNIVSSGVHLNDTENEMDEQGAEQDGNFSGVNYAGAHSIRKRNSKILTTFLVQEVNINNDSTT
jgi:hypothetical protein